MCEKHAIQNLVVSIQATFNVLTLKRLRSFFSNLMLLADWLVGCTNGTAILIVVCMYTAFRVVLSVANVGIASNICEMEVDKRASGISEKTITLCI